MQTKLEWYINFLRFASKTSAYVDEQPKKDLRDLYAPFHPSDCWYTFGSHPSGYGHWLGSEVDVRLGEVVHNRMLERVGYRLVHPDNPDFLRYPPATCNPYSKIIKIPPRRTFYSANAYYRMIFHELYHATAKLTERPTGNFCTFHPQMRMEELRAELASMILSEYYGLELECYWHLSYLRHWAYGLPAHDDKIAEVLDLAIEGAKLLACKPAEITSMLRERTSDRRRWMFPRSRAAS